MFSKQSRARQGKALVPNKLTGNGKSVIFSSSQKVNKQKTLAVFINSCSERSGHMMRSLGWDNHHQIVSSTDNSTGNLKLDPGYQLITFLLVCQYLSVD